MAEDDELVSRREATLSLELALGSPQDMLLDQCSELGDTLAREFLLKFGRCAVPASQNDFTELLLEEFKFTKEAGLNKAEQRP